MSEGNPRHIAYYAQEDAFRMNPDDFRKSTNFQYIYFMLGLYFFGAFVGYSIPHMIVAISLAIGFKLISVFIQKRAKKQFEKRKNQEE